MASTGDRPGAGTTGLRDDRILPETRWVAALIVPFLLVAFGILYLFPDHTKALFAWGIQPRMSAMLLGATYLSGAYFFVRAVTSQRWHLIQVGFLPVATFATTLGITNIVHWDRFTHGSIAFFAWAALYFTTPFIVLGIWLRNRTTDPGRGTLPDQTVPRQVRLAIGVVGGLTLAASLVIFLDPGFLVGIWAWQLTPLSARVLAALFALSAVGEISLAREARWSAVRIALQSLMVALAGVAVALLFSWSNFNRANPITWLFLAGALLLLVAVPLFYIWMERRAATTTKSA